MNRCKEVLIILLVLATIPNCTLHASKQDPEKAADIAIAFAKAALIDRDVNKAYDLLDPEAQSNVPKDRFAEILKDMTSESMVSVVTATEFEPMPGQDGINIYLTGDNGREKFYYRIPMKGNGDTGYKPFGLLRGQYAPSDSRQPLHLKRSTSR